MKKNNTIIKNTPSPSETPIVLKLSSIILSADLNSFKTYIERQIDRSPKSRNLLFNKTHFIYNNYQWFSLKDFTIFFYTEVMNDFFNNTDTWLNKESSDTNGIFKGEIEKLKIRTDGKNFADLHKKIKYLFRNLLSFIRLFNMTERRCVKSVRNQNISYISIRFMERDPFYFSKFIQYRNTLKETNNNNNNGNTMGSNTKNIISSNTNSDISPANISIINHRNFFIESMTNDDFDSIEDTSSFLIEIGGVIYDALILEKSSVSPIRYPIGNHDFNSTFQIHPDWLKYSFIIDHPKLFNIISSKIGYLTDIDEWFITLRQLVHLKTNVKNLQVYMSSLSHILLKETIKENIGRPIDNMSSPMIPDIEKKNIETNIDNRNYINTSFDDKNIEGIDDKNIEGIDDKNIEGIDDKNIEGIDDKNIDGHLQESTGVDENIDNTMNNYSNLPRIYKNILYIKGIMKSKDKVISRVLPKKDIVKLKDFVKLHEDRIWLS